MSNRLAFLNQEAPAHYVAGLGRGATGFTTRSDIGPAREGPDEEDMQAALAARAAALENGGDKDEGDDGRYQDPENETGLFSGLPYDKDDEEADRTFDLIEDTMLNRRNKKARCANEPGTSTQARRGFLTNLGRNRQRSRRFVATRMARYFPPSLLNSPSSSAGWRPSRMRSGRIYRKWET